MYLHESEYFKDIIMDVSNRSGINDDIVEKDYYITLILEKLSEMSPDVVFKGGTSLSKAHHIIDRFSEDVDITFTEHIGSARRKRLKYDVIGRISEEIGLPILNWENTESDKDYNRYEFGYKSVSVIDNPIPPTVLLETALMSYAFPTEEKNITSIIYDYLSESDRNSIIKYGLAPFSMKVQSVERTLIDKLFAVCDYYILKKPVRNSRHLYDIYKLKPYVIENEVFYNLVDEVRLHRSDMNVKVAPAAQDGVDIIEIVDDLCEEEYYKDDYENRTMGLISDDITYGEVINFYKELMNSIFER